MNSRAFRVGLLWHSATSGNLGVAALTVANIAIAREVAANLGLSPEFVILGMRDGERPYIDDPQVRSFVIDTRSLLSPAGLWSNVGPLDCILDIGGGDSFAEIYGAKRFGFLWLSKMLVLLRGKPLLFSPQTIGPFQKPAYRRLAKHVLERATAVIARDQKSYDFLRSLAPGANSSLATDVAFALPYQDRSVERQKNGTRIGLNVSGLLFKDAEEGHNRFGLDFNYAELTMKLMRAFTTMPGVEVQLFAHVAASDNALDSDGWICDRLAREFPNVVRVPNFGSPSEAKSYMSGLDFVVSGRMHACIGSFSSGVPVVPIAYSRKFSGLFGTLGYDWLVPTNGMDTDASFDFVLSCFGRRSEMSFDLQKGMARTGALLDSYRDELAKLFRSIRG